MVKNVFDSFLFYIIDNIFIKNCFEAVRETIFANHLVVNFLKRGEPDMKYSIHVSDKISIEVTKLNSKDVKIVKTDLQNGLDETIVLTKQQLYMIERFLKMGVV